MLASPHHSPRALAMAEAMASTVPDGTYIVQIPSSTSYISMVDCHSSNAASRSGAAFTKSVLALFSAEFKRHACHVADFARPSDCCQMVNPQLSHGGGVCFVTIV